MAVAKLGQIPRIPCRTPFKRSLYKPLVLNAAADGVKGIQCETQYVHSRLALAAQFAGKIGKILRKVKPCYQVAEKALLSRLSEAMSYLRAGEARNLHM